jgi:hypothetical protein
MTESDETDAFGGTATNPTSEDDVDRVDDPALQPQPGEQREPFPPVSDKFLHGPED